MISKQNTFSNLPKKAWRTKAADMFEHLCFRLLSTLSHSELNALLDEKAAEVTNV